MRKIIALLSVLLMVGCSQQAVIDTTVPIKPFSHVLSGPEVAEELNVLYLRRFPNCNNSDAQPAFLCSGVSLRVTSRDKENIYKVWDPSPTSQLSGGVSFSYLRSDTNFQRFAWDGTNGLIFYPTLAAPAGKIAVQYLCSYPVDAWGWSRNSPCGPYTDFPVESGPCQDTGVTTAEKWIELWSRPSDLQNLRQCSFDVRAQRENLAGPAFYQSVRAKGMLGARGFGEQNEVVVKTWTAGQPDTLPLMAFFYVPGSPASALADARYNQRDFYNTTRSHIIVPIIRLTLPATSTGAVDFSYQEDDQVISAQR
ncbi:halovibrin HvnC [Pseudomonas frederiksbergensis]|uniref:Halovibrin HvnC n=1 Tax=Pseudomonas frederiksbergensis TaxID=104087 RepID=A0A423K812_9PSED|nr:halovibrin HvnC [Pseudomonas frederiksbergensis]RON47887.1 halovibrin HvnC [Pseudomonas frederiksbergensis]